METIAPARNTSPVAKQQVSSGRQVPAGNGRLQSTQTKRPTSRTFRKVTNPEHRRRSISKMSYVEARRFLLKEESYCKLEMPTYFRFRKLIESVDKVLRGKNLKQYQKLSPKNFDKINHALLHNKDGRYSWRPMELIHPALYVAMVDAVTQREAWKVIRDKLNEFESSNKKIRCLSLPVKSLAGTRDVEEQINQWWMDIEQKSIELLLDYQFIIRTDITDCYADIYTHSVAWALHTKSVAKQRPNDNSLIGNVIDKHVQEMRNGQTNGIPQGSVLMDLVAELVLGYADTELTDRIAQHNITDYQILRYRDDYRVFVNNPKEGEVILKCLTEVMTDLGLKLNPQKTDVSGEIIQSSIKEDKLEWMLGKQGDSDLQKHLLIIHNHAINHPNSGSLLVAMRAYSRRLRRFKRFSNALPLISIVTDIAYRNPRTYRISAAILSKLLSFLPSDSERQEVVNKIVQRFKTIPNTGHMEVWLQRISLGFSSGVQFEEALCLLVDQPGMQFWNNHWISSARLRSAIDSNDIVDRKILDSANPIIPPDESELFVPDSGGY